MTDHSLMRRCHLAGLTRQQTADLTGYPLHHVTLAWQHLGLAERAKPPAYPDVDLTPIAPEPARPKPPDLTARFLELARIGWPATLIASELGMKVQSVVRKMQRMGFTPTKADLDAAWLERKQREAS